MCACDGFSDFNKCEPLFVVLSYRGVSSLTLALSVVLSWNPSHLCAGVTLASSECYLVQVTVTQEKSTLQACLFFHLKILKRAKMSPSGYASFISCTVKHSTMNTEMFLDMQPVKHIANKRKK